MVLNNFLANFQIVLIVEDDEVNLELMSLILLE